MASGTEGDEGDLFAESTAVAGYDAVTTRVPIADIARLAAAAQPTRMVAVLPRRPALAAGSVASARTVARPRRPRVGLGIFVFLTAAAVWGMAAYEVWFFFLR